MSFGRTKASRNWARKCPNCGTRQSKKQRKPRIQTRGTNLRSMLNPRYRARKRGLESWEKVWGKRRNVSVKKCNQRQRAFQLGKRALHLGKSSGQSFLDFQVCEKLYIHQRNEPEKRREQ